LKFKVGKMRNFINLTWKIEQSPYFDGGICLKNSEGNEIDNSYVIAANCSINCRLSVIVEQITNCGQRREFEEGSPWETFFDGGRLDFFLFVPEIGLDLLFFGVEDVIFQFVVCSEVVVIE
jgi:hypothetical protein